MSSGTYYEYIPVTNVHRVRIPDSIFSSRSKIENIYKISMKYKAVSRVHIGSGKKDFLEKENKVLFKHIRDARGYLFLPASSIKGVVSTNFLAICGSAELTSEVFGTTADKATISKVYFYNIYPQGRNLLEIVEIEKLWSPKPPKNNVVKIYISKAPETDIAGKIETLKVGTIFQFKLFGINLSEIELGTLLLSLGYNPSSKNRKFLKIGYAKPKAFGLLQPLDETLVIEKLEITEKFEVQHKILERKKILEIISNTKKHINNELSKLGFKDTVDNRFNIVFGWK
ncbi:MAG: RAMP superfamily CRISPR-associated protein [Candidatus Asgardarchaeum sp.]